MEVLSIPDWLTADFLQTCLQSEEDVSQKMVITNHTIERAVPPGNNYGSQLFRAKIFFKKVNESKENSVSLIIKAPITSGYIEELGLSYIYEREPKFYNEYIKETYHICKHDIVPRCYTSPNPLVLVLEDLKSLGYGMVDRHNLLDYEHSQLYIKASAKLHALSVVMNKKNPDLVKSLVWDSPQAVENTTKFNKTIAKFCVQCMIHYLEDKPDYKEFLDIFKEASESDVLGEMIEEVEHEKVQHRITTLIQVDPWCTNMMFKYNSSGDVESLKLLDFQGLKYTSPVREFVTFLWSSPQPDVRSKRLNDFYQIYCESLNANFKELNCPERLSFAEFKEEIAFFSPVVVISILCMMAPTVLADGTVDMNDFFSETMFKMPIKETSFYKLFEGIHFNRYYPQVLNEVSEAGIFRYFKEKMEEKKSKC